MMEKTVTKVVVTIKGYWWPCPVCNPKARRGEGALVPLGRGDDRGQCSSCGYIGIRSEKLARRI